MSDTALVPQQSPPDGSIVVWLTPPEIRAQVNRIQEVLRQIMQEGVHYGTIPGTQKPTLYKAGAELLAATFRLRISPEIEADLSSEEEIRYRVRAVATAEGSGVFLGSHLGECSSHEEKYKWRQAVCDEEFQETEVDHRRRKWKRGKDGAYAIFQVRTEPADIANTVLKMAEKRALVGVVLQTLAASDCFSQDIEDLPPEVREQVQAERPVGAGETNGAKASRPPSGGGEVISDAQAQRAFAIGKAKGFSTDQYRALIKKHGYQTDRDIPKQPKSIYDGVIADLEKGPNGGGSEVPPNWK
jgi:hypothetical protein